MLHMMLTLPSRLLKLLIVNRASKDCAQNAKSGS